MYFGNFLQPEGSPASGWRRWSDGGGHSRQLERSFSSSVEKKGRKKKEKKKKGEEKKKKSVWANVLFSVGPILIFMLGFDWICIRACGSNPTSFHQA